MLPKATSFPEFKILHCDKKRSVNPNMHPGTPALGRGGAGPGVFVHALVDHSFGEQMGVNWQNFREARNIPGQMMLAQFMDCVHQHQNSAELPVAQ